MPRRTFYAYQPPFGTIERSGVGISNPSPILLGVSTSKLNRSHREDI